MARVSSIEHLRTAAAPVNCCAPVIVYVSIMLDAVGMFRHLPAVEPGEATPPGALAPGVPGVEAPGVEVPGTPGAPGA